MPPRWTRPLFLATSSRTSHIPRRSFALSSTAAATAVTLSEPLLPHVAPSLAPLILALLLLNARTHEEEDDDGNPFAGETLPISRAVPYTVQPVKGAGLGAIASKPIQRGEVIITDSPLLVWPQGIASEEAETLVGQLTPKARAIFEGLANSMSADRELGEVLGKRATNAFAVQVPPVPADAMATADLPDVSRVSVLYPNIARINHSCLPSADNAIDWSTLRMTVYAATEIRPRDEICIEYIPLVAKTRAERQALLSEHFGFTCSCRACSLPTAESAASDQRRSEVGKLARRVSEEGVKGTNESRREVVRGLERIRVLLAEERYQALPEFDDDVVSRAYVLYIANRARFQDMQVQP